MYFYSIQLLYPVFRVSRCSWTVLFVQSSSSLPLFISLKTLLPLQFPHQSVIAFQNTSTIPVPSPVCHHFHLCGWVSCLHCTFHFVNFALFVSWYLVLFCLYSTFFDKLFYSMQQGVLSVMYLWSDIKKIAWFCSCTSYFRHLSSTGKIIRTLLYCIVYHNCPSSFVLGLFSGWPLVWKTCQWNVKHFTINQGNVRETILSGKVA